MKSELTENDRRVLSMIAEKLGDEWFAAERQLFARLIMSEKVKEFRRRPGAPVPASVKTNDPVSEGQIKL